MRQNPKLIFSPVLDSFHLVCFQSVRFSPFCLLASFAGVNHGSWKMKRRQTSSRLRFRRHRMYEDPNVFTDKEVLDKDEEVSHDETLNNDLSRHSECKIATNNLYLFCLGHLGNGCCALLLKLLILLGTFGYDLRLKSLSLVQRSAVYFIIPPALLN